MTGSPCLPPCKPTVLPALKVPAGAWDTHVHVIGNPEQFPFALERSYTPALCDIHQYIDWMNLTGVAKAVLVQPSIYGTDNAAMLYAMAAFPQRFVGIAVVSPTISDAELDTLADKGVKGIRVNITNKGGISISQAQQLAHRIARLGWHIELQLPTNALEQAKELIAIANIVLDHFSFIDPAHGLSGADFKKLLRLLDRERCWVKLSAPYRISPQWRADYAAATPYVNALIHANPNRLLWGSDWPHTDIHDDMPDDGMLLEALWQWLPDTPLRHKVLVDNPLHLYAPQ